MVILGAWDLWKLQWEVIQLQIMSSFMQNVLLIIAAPVRLYLLLCQHFK